ncbi:integral membrane protein [Ilyonectria robusta]
MDFLKKAKTQVKGAVQDAQGMYGQYKQQQKQQPQQPPQGSYHQVTQGSHHQPPQGNSQQAPPPTPGYPQHQPLQGYQQPVQGYQQPQQGHPQPHAGYQQQQQSYVPQGGYQQPPQSPQQGYQPNHNNGQPSYSTVHHNAPQPAPLPPHQPFNMNSLHQALPDATHQPPPASAVLYSQPLVQLQQPSPANQMTPPVNHDRRPNLPSAVSSPPPPPVPASAATNVVRSAAIPQPTDSSYPTPSHAQPPSVSLLAAVQKCPRHEEASVDLIQFYILQAHVLQQVQPALGADSLSMCAACFSTYIAPYPNLASNFQLRKRTESHPDAPQASFEKLTCHFALPTVRQIFYQQCVPSGTVVPLLQFEQFAGTLPTCKGTLVEQPVEYYESNRGDGFGCCKTCFELFIRSTAFERGLVLKSPDSGWLCDIGARGYLFRALIADLEDQRPDFDRFSSKSKQRTALPFCLGKGNRIVPEGSDGPHFTFEPVGGKSGVLCQACYWDKVHGTSMEPFFNVYTEIELQYYDTATCDLAGIVETFAMEAAIRAGDDEVWRRCLVGRATLPACKGVEGVEEETLEGQDETNKWYCFTEYPSIEVCPFCYCATVEILGAGHLFSPITRPLRPGVLRMCFLAQAQDLDADVSDASNFENTLVWRGTMLRNWLHHGYSCHGNFYGLKHVAKAIASWPPPCNAGLRALKPVNKRKWYGNKFYAVGDENMTGIRLCEECFEHYVKDTLLESFVGEDLTDQVYASLPDGCRCCTQTRRARDELSSACQKGDFLQFSKYWAARTDCRERHEAMNEQCNRQAAKQKQALDVLNIQNQMASIQLMQGLTANTNAIIMGIGGSVAEAASPDYGQRYGNAAVGNGYLTGAGANAAQARIDAAATMSKGISVADFHSTGDTWQDTQQLLLLSKALQAEWDAIK